MDDNCNLTGWRWFLTWWSKCTEGEQIGFLFTVGCLIGIPTLLLIALLWHIANLIAGMPPS